MRTAASRSLANPKRINIMASKNLSTPRRALSLYRSAKTQWQKGRISDLVHAQLERVNMNPFANTNAGEWFGVLETIHDDILLTAIGA
jgi:hypothetical protein